MRPQEYYTLVETTAETERHVVDIESLNEAHLESQFGIGDNVHENTGNTDESMPVTGGYAEVIHPVTKAIYQIPNDKLTRLLNQEGQVIHYLVNYDSSQVRENFTEKYLGGSDGEVEFLDTFAFFKIFLHF